MKVYEFLRLYKPLLTCINRNNIDIDDVIYLDIYHDYLDIKGKALENDMSEREIHAFLSKEYKIPLPKIKKAINRLNEDLNI